MEMKSISVAFQQSNRLPLCNHISLNHVIAQSKHQKSTQEHLWVYDYAFAMDRIHIAAALTREFSNRNNNKKQKWLL